MRFFDFSGPPFGSRSEVVITIVPKYPSPGSILVTLLFLPNPRHFPGFFVLFFLMGRLMTSFLPSTGRSLDCLLSEPSIMPQSLSSEVSGVRPAHHDSQVESLGLHMGP